MWSCPCSRFTVDSPFRLQRFPRFEATVGRVRQGRRRERAGVLWLETWGRREGERRRLGAGELEWAFTYCVSARASSCDVQTRARARCMHPDVAGRDVHLAGDLGRHGRFFLVFGGPLPSCMSHSHMHGGSPTIANLIFLGGGAAAAHSWTSPDRHVPCFDDCDLRALQLTDIQSSQSHPHRDMPCSLPHR